jgi:hypothetical protein
MLSEFQKRKLIHYFNILDYNDNGVIESDDFEAVGDNLCILWGFREHSMEYKGCMQSFRKSWEDFKKLVPQGDSEKGTLDEWLYFCDKYLVNGPDNFFEKYIGKLSREIFDLFDNNEDGYISLDEYIDLFMAYHIEIRYSAKSFTKLDKNHDDRISKEELIRAIYQFFRSDDEKSPGNWLFGFWEAPKSRA